MPGRDNLIGELVEIYSRPDPAYAQARRWRFDAALGHAPVDFAGTVVISLALGAIFVDLVSPLVLASWLGIVNALSLTRLLIALRVPHMQPPARRRAERLFSITLAGHGMMWAVAFFLFAPPDAVAERSAVLVWLAGTAAWVVAAYTLMFESVLAFLLVQILPVAVYLLFTNDRLWQLVAIACFIFIPAMAMIAIRNNAMLIRGHITRLEREELADALEREKEAVEALNRSLEADLQRREVIELDLREAKDRAETLAAELEKLSSLDGLTGIANRRRFDQTLEREWNRAIRSRQPLAMILCDIDYFKQYNDRYGHQAGDACLRQLAQLLGSSLRRGGDLAARYGGEEFAILLPDTELANAAALAETIRERLQRIGMPHDASLAAPVLTASFGVAAVVPHRGMAADLLVRHADEALYAAKAKGRNRVISHGNHADVAGSARDSLLH